MAGLNQYYGKIKEKRKEGLENAKVIEIYELLRKRTMNGNPIASMMARNLRVFNNMNT